MSRIFSFILKYVAFKLRARPKIEQHSDFDLSGPQIIKELLFPCRLNLPACLQFDDDLPVNQQVGAKIADFLPVEKYRHRNLALKKNTALARATEKACS